MITLVLTPSVLLGLILLAYGLPEAPALEQRSAPPANRTGGPGIAEARIAEAPIAEVERLFRVPPDDSRIMMRWWWFGSAVTRAQIERELRLMKEGGIGGVEVQPVYPLALDDTAAGIKNISFLSDEFIEALRFAAAKARELGLRFDVTLGSGWPYGGPQVPMSDAAGRLRVERVKVAQNVRRVAIPSLIAGESLIASFLLVPGEQSAEGRLREVTEFADGAAQLPAGLQAATEVLFFISSRTGMQVKRPAAGAEGFVLNHLDKLAVQNYLKNVGDRLMQAFKSDPPPYAIFCDSLEVYNADWTTDLLPEFNRRRGYDLKPYLPALVADIGPMTPGIRRDWGKTLTELLNERFLAPMHEWSQRNQTRFRVQCYGVPAAALSSNVHADLSEGEGHQWTRLSSTRWASSASHIYGQPVTSSETWTWLHSPSFRATPLDVKAEADLHFLQGINQLIGHGWPYTAEGAEYPGWRFYAAGVFNEKNPWWIAMPDVSRYLQRLSVLLRQGAPANDVAIYLPNDDAWAHFTNGNINLIEALRERLGPAVIPRVLEAGFNFDFFDDEVLSRVGRIENGVLRFGASSYRAVILPNVERIPLETIQKLEAFARGGGVLVATRRIPSASPGFLATQSDHRRILDISSRLFTGSTPPAHLVEDEDSRLTVRLAGLLSPDVTFSPSAPAIGFIRRKLEDAEIYLLVNTSNTRQQVTASFRVKGMAAEWWDPFTGNVTRAGIESGPAERTAVALSLEPYGSRVLVFAKRTLPGYNAANSLTVTGRVDLSTDWVVSFGSRGEPTAMNRLLSWTENERTRYFSGVARYEKTVSAPDNFLQDGVSVRLDFGEGSPAVAPARPSRSPGMYAQLDGPVREAAVVYINDRRAGSIWCPPYSLDVTGLLRRGENRIRIEVGNTAINYLAGRSLPDYRLLNLRYGERFQQQDMNDLQPLPSGLVGSIHLTATQ